jgi:hypothetical protein
VAEHAGIFEGRGASWNKHLVARYAAALLAQPNNRGTLVAECCALIAMPRCAGLRLERKLETVNSLRLLRLDTSNP